MIRSLVGIRLRAMFAGMTGKRADRRGAPSSGRIVLIILLSAFIGLVFAYMSFFFGLTLALICIPNGQEWLMYGFFLFVAFTIVFIFSIFETKNELFDCKDNDLLLSLPIAPEKIVLARVLTVLLYNYAEAAIVLLPAFVAFSLCGASMLYFAGGLLCFLVLPLAATALSCVFGYLMALISRRFRHKNILTVVLSAAFIAAYFFLYTRFLGSVGDEITQEQLEALMRALAFLRPLGEAAMWRPLPLILFLLTGIGVSVLTWWIISRSYLRIATDQRGSARTEYRARTLRQRSAFAALTHKEFARFFSSPTYMLNAGFGLFLSVIATVFFLLRRDSLTALLQQTDIPFSVLLPALVCSAGVFFSAMNFQSAAAVSLEGKNLWIVRCAPVRARTILFAKMMPQFTLTVCVNAVCGSVCLVALGAPWYYFPLLLVSLSTATLLFCAFGICMNVVFPRFDFINDAQPVKQSVSCFLVSLIQMLYAGVCAALTGVFGCITSGAAALALVCVLHVGLGAMCMALVCVPCAGRFDRL